MLTFIFLKRTIFLCAVERHGRSVGANPIRQLFAPAGSNRSSHGGNEVAEGFDIAGHKFWWQHECAGRNVSER